MRNRRILPAIAATLVFLVLEAGLYSVVVKNSEVQRTWFAGVGHSFMGSVWGASESVRRYFSLADENLRLGEENYKLSQEVLQMREQLRKAGAQKADPEDHPGFTANFAEVVKMSRGRQHNYLIINRGFEDGIKEKSGVLTRNGAVGIVDAVSAHHAFVLSFQNYDISISARLGQEGGSGILVWDGIRSNGAILKEIPLQFHYERGDTVFTSGHSLIFPPDVPLGVAGDSRVVNGSTSEISVTLFQDFSAIRYVSVVHNNSFDEISQFGE